MTSPATRLIVSSLLVAAGVLCWAASRTADRLALQHERLATLQPPAVDDAGRWDALVESSVAAGLGESAVTPSQLSADYWAGRYDAVASSDASNQADDTLLLMAANASFRAAQREAGDRLPPAERLDRPLQAYAGVLKNGGFNRDAAYNFEFVARLRDSSERAKSQISRQPPPRPRTRPDDDLPAGPTIHGTRGTHPPGTKGEEFEVLTPMDYGEREAQPEATPGRRLPRKG